MIRFPIAAVNLPAGRSANAIAKEAGLQRLFSTFPSGWPGLGLLLLRVAVGLTAIVQGGVFLNDGTNNTTGMLVVALLAVTSGVLLLIGFLTPAACIVSGLTSLGFAFSWLASPASSLNGGKGLSSALVVTVTAAIVLLGPGAFSIDARLFGRRAIIIPEAPRSPKI